jgi:transcriptional regulator with XRE-family HTH domain
VTDLKRKREALRLSQSALARIAGIPRVRICLYELGDRQLTGEEQNQINAAIQREAERLRNVVRDVVVHSH